jgi:deoxyadenosine/deoxycytidine kinase
MAKTMEDIPLQAFRPYTRRRVKQERWLQQFRGHIYVLEGNIGSGKSTLGRLMECFARRRHLEATFLPERFPDALLQAFILWGDEHPGDPNPHAFALQREILQLRHATYLEALDWAQKGHVVFVDRSLPGDYVFALLNHALGNISDEDWREYTAMLEEIDVLEPTAIVYLDASVTACLQRIGKRSRDAEDKYKPEYLARVEETYQRVLPSLGYPMLSIPWSEERRVEDTSVCETLATSIFHGLEQLLHSDRDENPLRVIV